VVDLAAVDALARLFLAAKRRGWRVELGGLAPDFVALLRLVGLAEVLGLEVVGEPEELEQLGIEERVQRADLRP
jgi:hypothetical protein